MGMRLSIECVCEMKRRVVKAILLASNAVMTTNKIATSSADPHCLFFISIALRWNGNQPIYLAEIF